MGSSDDLNLEKMLQMGISAAKQGNKDGARVLLKQVLDMDKKNERAWLWMAHVAESSAKRRQYLETVLKINPKNASAKQALQKFAQKQAHSEQRTLAIAGVVLFGILACTMAIFVLAALAR